MNWEVETVSSLFPGEVVHMMGRQAVYIEQAPHPIYAGLRLVLWKLDTGEWSHDALDPRQEVGETLPSTPEERRVALRWALLRQGEPPWQSKG